MNATTDCCADSFPRVSVWQGTRQKTLLTWPIGPMRCREKSWATGHRRSCLTKNWTESTPSEHRLRFVLPPVGASPLPPEEQTALTKIVTCQNYCNSPKCNFWTLYQIKVSLMISYCLPFAKKGEAFWWDKILNYSPNINLRSLFASLVVISPSPSISARAI